MTIGLRIRGAAGQNQIDESYSNHHLLSKQTVTTTTPVGNAGSSFVDLTFTGCEGTILALQCALHATYTIVAVSGSTWTFRIIVETAPGNVVSTGTAVTVFRFESSPPPSTAIAGIRIRNPATKKIVFDSGYKPLRVIDRKLDVPSILVSSGTDWNYPAGRSYAFVPARGGGYAETFGIPGQTGTYASWFYMACLTKPSGVNVQATLHTTSNFTTPPTGQTYSYNAASDWLIVDVTGF